MEAEKPKILVSSLTFDEAELFGNYDSTPAVDGVALFYAAALALLSLASFILFWKMKAYAFELFKELYAALKREAQSAIAQEQTAPEKEQDNAIIISEATVHDLNESEEELEEEKNDKNYRKPRIEISFKEGRPILFVKE